MLVALGPDVARAAVGLRASHPAVHALDALDVCLRQRAAGVGDFGQAIEPGTPLALLIAEAFDTGMEPTDWLLATNPNTDPAVVAALHTVWRTQVLPRFASRYGLTL